MLRCEPVGKYKVELSIPHEKVSDYRVAIAGHGTVYASVGEERVVAEKAPEVSTTEPYVGELCLHEVQWLNGEAGHAYPAKYVFTVTEL